MTNKQPQAPTKNVSQALELIANEGTSLAKIGDRKEVAMRMAVMRATVPGLNRKKKKYDKDADEWIEQEEYAVSDFAVLGLYLAERSSGLSSMRGEIYPTDNGIMVATKIRTADAVRAAAQAGDTLSVRYKTLAPSHPLWHEYAAEYNLQPGDTVRLIEVNSTKQYSGWYANRLAKANELRACGFVGVEIQRLLNDEFGISCEPMRCVGVVKAEEEFDKGFKPKNKYEMAKQATQKAIKQAQFSRSDRADKRAFSRWLSKYGYSAPDTRNYGGAMMAESAANADAVIAAGSDIIEGTTVEAGTPKPSERATRNAFGSGVDDDLLAGYTGAKAKQQEAPAVIIEDDTQEGEQQEAPLTRADILAAASEWLQAHPLLDNAQHVAELRSFTEALGYIKPTEATTAGKARAAFAEYVISALLNQDSDAGKQQQAPEGKLL